MPLFQKESVDDSGVAEEKVIIRSVVCDYAASWIFGIGVEYQLMHHVGSRESQRTARISGSLFRFLRKLNNRGLFKHMDDRLYLKFMFRSRVGRWPNLNKPTSFNEKIQWLKIYDRNPLYTELVDKIKVKEWAAKRIGSEHIIPTLRTWDDVDDIRVDDLPCAFVLKTNHDSGGVIVCDRKEGFDLRDAKKKLRNSLRRNYYYSGREWPYKNIKPRILLEEFVCPEEGTSLVDYKFLCFGGVPKCAFTCTGREAGDLRVDFFDMEWNHLPFQRHYPCSSTSIEKPIFFEEMVEASLRLAKDLPFVRVDFYENDRNFYFGEMTLYPGSGFEEFSPEIWDYKLGDLLILPGYE